LLEVELENARREILKIIENPKQESDSHEKDDEVYVTA
jgi:hypothetical protein